VLCISRHHNDELGQRATDRGARCDQWPQDLTRPEVAGARLEGWLAQHGPDAFASATLINNAALLPRIGPLSILSPTDVADTMRVDLEAPLVLTAVFLRATAAWKGVRKVLNISSGLGRRAMASQALYCAAKAGMDHFTRCVALEEAARPNGARVCSLAPGIIDTEMQVQLRTADVALMPDVGNFVDYKEKGMLASPPEAAARVLAYLARPDFGSNPVGSVND